MKSILKILLGLNVISITHLARFKPTLFLTACKNAFSSARKVMPKDPFPIPEVQLIDILAERRPLIRLSVVRHDDGMLPSDQAMALLSILVAEAPSEVLEIGTFMGHTTRQIAENLPAVIVHTVDLPKSFSAENDSQQSIPKDDFHLIARRVVGRDFIGHSCANRIRQHFADTADWNFREAGHPTFFFIDGSHTYEYCKNDSIKCFGLSQIGSVILWHDCDDAHPGVVKFISEWRQLRRDIRRISGTPIAYWKVPNPERSVSP